eukprot:s1687_g11.t1
MCPTRIHVADKHLNMFERPGTPTGDADKKVSSFEFQSVTYGPCTQPDAFTFRGVEFCMTPACQHCNIPLCGMFWLLWTVASHCASCDLLMAQGQARMFLDAFALRLGGSLHVAVAAAMLQLFTVHADDSRFNTEGFYAELRARMICQREVLANLQKRSQERIVAWSADTVRNAPPVVAEQHEICICA